MNDKPFIIGLNDLYLSNGGTFEPLNKIVDKVVTFSSSNESTEVMKDFNNSFSFTMRTPPLRILRLLGVVSGNKRNPLKAKEIMEFIKHNQLN